MSDQTCLRSVTIVNPEGLHLRAAGVFVRVANRFQSEVVVVRDMDRVSGKSMLDLLTLGAYQGVELTLEATGPDAEAAV
ncbi:MAG TPA: HPr family phosphocarrier protein [Pirellulales bacterium]